MHMIAEELVNQVRAAVREAGQVIEAVRRGGVDVQDKADGSPVTQADRAADALLKRELTRLIPAGWLSEESADDSARLAQQRLWVVDPLDGTKEFIEGVAQYAVAVALVESGEPRLAVVHNPASGEEFWASAGQGAYGDGVALRAFEGPKLLASRSEMRRGEFAVFEDDWDIVPIGSIAYKLALVARGDGALTFSRGPKHEWDVCAGDLIVREAGGVVTDAYGDPLRYNNAWPKVKGIVAGAPASHARALATIRELGPSSRMAEMFTANDGR